MSRPISSQKNVSLDLQEGPTQKNLDEINAFTNSLKSNERIKISSGPGVTLVFTRYKESFPEQGLRRIGNFINSFKAIRAFNNDQIHNAAINSEIYLLFRKANGAQHVMPELLKIHSHVSKKFHAGDQPSISAKNFQSQINPLTKKLSVPVFETLQTPSTKEALKNLALEYESIPAISVEVAFLSGSGEKLSDVAEEMRSFFGFVKDQANGKSATYPDSKAVDFAKRWKDCESEDNKPIMQLRFGVKNCEAISQAADTLLEFIKA